MGSFINNDSSRCAMSGENIFDQTFGYNLNIIRGSCYCLYPLGDIIKGYKDVLIYKGLRKRSHEVNVQHVKQFNF